MSLNTSRAAEIMVPHNAPSWRALVRRLAPDKELIPPALVGILAEAERNLGIDFPKNLRAFLMEADGLVDEYGAGIIWSAFEIEKRNLAFRNERSFRELYMPFDHLLFIGDDGGGNQFALAIQADGHIHRSDVYCWEHESDSRSWYAPRLERYLESRLIGEDEA